MLENTDFKDEQENNNDFDHRNVHSMQTTPHTSKNKWSENILYSNKRGSTQKSSTNASDFFVNPGHRLYLNGLEREKIK